MLNTVEERKKHIQATRLKNYRASMVLEGISSTNATTLPSKAQLIDKYTNTKNNR